MRDVPYDDPEFAAELGRSIRLLRIDRDIERRDLAEQAGISYSYLSAIENGGKTPSARLLYALAGALGVRDDELLAMARARLEPRAAPAPLPPPAPMAAAATPMAAPPAAAPGRRFRRRRAQPGPDVDELTELLDQLDPEDAAAVLDLARRLAGRRGSDQR